ncbi:MAG TPA: ATP-binding protein [Methylomirabilota bacterium]|jgi:signal transduction histidine kinase/PAS domain-containing protein|nr:ATP-binding protein [Methylomirabilota bacterium]
MASRRASRPGDLTEEKLHLLETFLTSEDSAECARHAIHWLVDRFDARRVLCAAPDVTSGRLVALAGAGVGRSDPPAFTVDLERRDDPLVAALTRIQSTMLDLGSRHGLPRDTYLAFPLHGLSLEELAQRGLLLVSPVSPVLAREARWLAGLLGPRITSLRSYRALSESHRKLERERSLLQAVIDAAADPILLTDTDGAMLVANASAENLFASHEEESEGRGRAVALNNMLFSAALSGAAMAGGEILRRELLLADPQEGSDLLFELLGTVLRESQQIIGVVSILRNVVDLRRATEEIEENYRKLRVAEADVRADRDRLRLVMDAVTDPILVTDTLGQIIEMNTPAERLLMSRPNAGEASTRILANDAHFSSFLSNLLFGGDATLYQAQISLTEPESGEALPFDASAAKVLSEHGELIGIVTLLHDSREAQERQRLYEQLKAASGELEEKVRQATTELVRQNELLRRQQIQLEQASAAKSQFLANISHEFRTPLNAILGYTSMLLAGVSGEMMEEQVKDLTRVESNSKTLLSLINDILDISRIESGKVPVTIVAFPVPELVSEVMDELDPIIARSKLKVTTELDTRATIVRSDRQKVKQILLNFLSNALKFTHEGSITVIAGYKGSGEVWLSVKDTGIGIAPEEQKKVFEDFHQVDSSPTREYGGTGLGLAICARLASVLGGRIALDSVPGSGSTFTLVLPEQREKEQ